MFRKFSSLGEMLLKGPNVAESFYPFVENGDKDTSSGAHALVVTHPARIAVYDDAAAAPRVVVVEPKDIRSYLEEITATVTKLANEQGGSIPFTVIREVVENLIHAYFMEPTVSILDGGNTIRFSDQGPGIQDKERALEYGTSSATSEMKRYIRGVGSGLPYAQQWLRDKGGSLTVEDNIHNGTVVTVSLAHAEVVANEQLNAPVMQGYQQAAPNQWQAPQGMPPAMSTPQQPWGAAAGTYAQPSYGYQQAPFGQPAMPQPYAQPWPQQPYAQPAGYPPQQPQAGPSVSERGGFALQYLMTHESVGPRDLNAAWPLSESTWSRELSQLEAQGLISKQGGQKRRLTTAGRIYLGIG